MINLMKPYLPVLLIGLLPFALLGDDKSTPPDGNLAIQSSFYPGSVIIYPDASILEEQNLSYESKRIYRMGDTPHITEWNERTINSDIAWIDEETYVMLTGNTNRYPHAILGDDIESTGFRIYRNDELIHEYELPSGRVFETLRPLVADLIPQIGGEEIILTSSHQSDGARVDVFSQEGKLLKSSEAIGRGFRWLHILGVMKLGESESPYLPLVKTPHIGGVLELLYWNGEELVKKASFGNVSTHRIGSDNLNMALLLEQEESADSRIILPTRDFKTLLLIGFDGNRLREVNRIELPGILNTNLFYHHGDDPSLWLGLTDGRILRITDRE